MGNAAGFAGNGRVVSAHRKDFYEKFKTSVLRRCRLLQDGFRHRHTDYDPERHHELREHVGQYHDRADWDGGYVRCLDRQPDFVCVSSLPLRGGLRRRYLYRAVLRAEQYGRHPPYRPLQAVGCDSHHVPHCFAVHFFRPVPDQHLPDRGGQRRERKSCARRRQTVHALYACRASFFYGHAGLRQHAQGVRPDDPAHEIRHRGHLHQPCIQLSVNLREVRLSDAGSKGRGHRHGALPRGRGGDHRPLRAQGRRKKSLYCRAVPEFYDSARRDKAHRHQGYAASVQ